MLFWLPAVHRLAADAADDAEITADDAAAAGRPLVLASVILALASWRTPPAFVRASVGFYLPELLDRRIRRLAGEEPAVTGHVTRRSLAGAALALGLVWTSGVLIANPVSSERPATLADCVDKGEPAASHLPCLGSRFDTLRLRCSRVGRW